MILIFWRGRSPPERLCARACGPVRIRRYPLFCPVPDVARTDLFGTVTSWTEPGAKKSPGGAGAFLGDHTHGRKIKFYFTRVAWKRPLNGVWDSPEVLRS